MFVDYVDIFYDDVIRCRINMWEPQAPSHEGIVAGVQRRRLKTVKNRNSLTPPWRTKDNAVVGEVQIPMRGNLYLQLRT